MKRLLSSAAFLIIGATSSIAQSYNLAYSPQSGQRVFAYCRQILPSGQLGDIVYWCQVNIYTGYYAQTNAHFHEGAPAHPGSSAVCIDPSQCTPSGVNVGLTMVGNTTWKGSIEVQVNTTLVGQAEYIAANTPYGTNKLEYVVGYKDIYYNDHPEIWLRIGGTDTGANTGHGNTYYNRYMATNAAWGLYYATNDYLNAHPGQALVCANDMALPFGGKFDIDALVGGAWTSPHSSHDRGSAADIAGPGSGQCPAAYQVDVSALLQACVARGANPVNSINEANHAHCNWLSPSSYPH